MSTENHLEKFFQNFSIFSSVLRYRKKSFRPWRKRFGPVVKTEFYARVQRTILRDNKILTLSFIFRTSCVNFSEFDQTFRPSCQNANLHVQKSIPERNRIFHQNIFFHIIFGLRADIFSTFDKLFPELL